MFLVHLNKLLNSFFFFWFNLLFSIFYLVRYFFYLFSHGKINQLFSYDLTSPELPFHQPYQFFIIYMEAFNWIKSKNCVTCSVVSLSVSIHMFMPFFIVYFILNRFYLLLVFIYFIYFRLTYFLFLYVYQIKCTYFSSLTSLSLPR